jgi:hypothetical protein
MQIRSGANSRARRKRLRIFALVLAEGLNDAGTFVPEVVCETGNTDSVE